MCVGGFCGLVDVNALHSIHHSLYVHDGRSLYDIYIHRCSLCVLECIMQYTVYQHTVSECQLRLELQVRLDLTCSLE